MAIQLKMPALSPTMEHGTLAKWLVKEGDSVSSGDIMAEIETDKATMEFEAVDEGVIAKILVNEGTEDVKVGEVIAIIAEEDEDPAEAAAETKLPPVAQQKSQPSKAEEDTSTASAPERSAAAPAPSGETSGDRIKASPLAKRLAKEKGVDLSALKGSGPGGRIVKADVDGAGTEPAKSVASDSSSAKTSEPSSAGTSTASTPEGPSTSEIPHVAEKLSGMRKVIARRLTESKQQVPHIYLTVDIRLDALLKLRGELNAALEAQGVKISVNDMLIKALAKALIMVPSCNVQYDGDHMLKFSRADISVAVSIPAGLITPIVEDAGAKSISAIATEMKDLASRAKEGKLQPQEYQGGTASISNMGMMGIKQFEAVINPPQGMILAIGAGEKRPYVIDDSLQIATVMSATGSFDHRAIDGADGAELMKVFKELVEAPLSLVA